MKNLKCYSNHHDNCSEDITREHYISETILKQFNTNMVSGMPWLEGKVVALPPNALASNILCGRHNNELSFLDALAGKTFTHLREMNSNSPIYKNIQNNISGDDFELWVLKVLCGMIASKNAGADGMPIEFKIPEQWIDILYKKIDMPSKWGLYFFAVKGSQIDNTDSIRFSPITQKGNHIIIGCILELRNFRFALFLQDDLATEDWLHHPKKIHLQNGRFKHSLKMNYITHE